LFSPIIQYYVLPSFFPPYLINIQQPICKEWKSDAPHSSWFHSSNTNELYINCACTLMIDENVHVYEAKVQVDRNACKPSCKMIITIIRYEQRFKWQENIS
jgi:hypothetical protein